MPEGPNRFLKILRKRFGCDAFRPGQLEAIETLADGGDALVVMPTGFGKSLCYQLPALTLPGTALVVSPLISLMKDQVDSLTKNQIPATLINSSLSYQEIDERINNAVAGKYKLIFIAPERLKSHRFLEKLQGADISFLAVDEAHCISQWGHDFRPSYLSIAGVRDIINIGGVIALTATATPEVQDDIVRSLKMSGEKRIIKGFDRPNLSYKTIDVDDKLEKLISICKNQKEGSIIVYCGSRKRVEYYAEGLQKKGAAALIYHAGLPPNVRKDVQDRFLSGAARIIAATNAFGMGIDKPDVRIVVHCDLTSTLESYYQEAGRAGRDGKPAECVLLYHPSDRNLQEFFIQSSYPSKIDIEKIYNVLYDINQTPVGAKPLTPIFLDGAQLANRAGLPFRVASSAMALMERNDILSIVRGKAQAKIQFTTSRERLIDYYNSAAAENKKALDALLRSASGEALQNEVEIDVAHMLRKHNIGADEFKRAALALEFARIIRYLPSGASGGIIIKKDRAPFKNAPIDFSEYDLRKRHAYRKLDVVQRYAETQECKRNFILSYFKETGVEGVCGICGSCLGPQKKPQRRSSRQKGLLLGILSSAAELDGRFGSRLLADFVKGADAILIEKYDLQKARYYGCGKKYELIEIEDEIKKAVYDRYLSISADIYPLISLTGAGGLLLDKEIKPFRPRTRRKDEPRGLYGKLLELRDELARREKVVPRAIAGPKAIKTLAEALPANAGDLAAIPGIGPIFISRYGEKFLCIINEYRLSSEEETKRPAPLPKEILEAMRLLNEGNDISRIADIMKTGEGAAARYIQRAVENGVSIDASKIIPEGMLEQVRRITLRSPGAPLRQIRAEIDGAINYPALRVAAAIVREELKRQKKG